MLIFSVVSLVLHGSPAEIELKKDCFSLFHLISVVSLCILFILVVSLILLDSPGF